MDILLLFTFLAIKHSFADLFLQTFHHSIDKGKYISSAHRHYLEHALLTLFICLFFVSPWSALMASLIDYIFHWHIDFAKHKLIRYLNIERGTKEFFRVQTFDQILHFLTYALIIFILLLQ